MPGINIKNIPLPTASKNGSTPTQEPDTRGKEEPTRDGTTPPSTGTGVMGGVAGALNKAFEEKRNADTFG